ncbi:MAG: hypothetical protein CR993_00225 [Rhodobacterales bacterium]|nr:MAG: hypothetical protein CR993_00225 [Rhodobacterales bacterium]
MKPTLTRLILCFSLAAGAALAQSGNVVIVPLDPVNPDEVVPSGELGEIQEIDPETGEIVRETIEFLDPGSVVGQDVTTVTEQRVREGSGAVLRFLDKFAGSVEEAKLAKGDTIRLGWLQVALGECRYPEDNPSGDAFAWLVIREDKLEEPVFQGWMVASSPALNALDHARFDIWVTQCITE